MAGWEKSTVDCFNEENLALEALTPEASIDGLADRVKLMRDDIVSSSEYQNLIGLLGWEVADDYDGISHDWWADILWMIASNTYGNNSDIDNWEVVMWELPIDGSMIPFVVSPSLIVKLKTFWRLQNSLRSLSFENSQIEMQATRELWECIEEVSNN